MSDHPAPLSGPRAPSAGPHADGPLLETLRSLGYDIESPREGDSLPGALVARRERGDHAVLFTADAGGRFRAEITWRVGEWPSNVPIGGITARVVDGVMRSVSVAGQIDDGGSLSNVVAALEAIMPWADTTAEDGLHSPQHHSRQ